jgi:hypothetical protein
MEDVREDMQLMPRYSHRLAFHSGVSSNSTEHSPAEFVVKFTCEVEENEEGGGDKARRDNQERLYSLPKIVTIL